MIKAMGGNGGVEFMDTFDSPWYWYYVADCERWHRFEDDPDSQLSSTDLENLYQRNSKGVLTISSSNYCRKIDFSAMLETNLTTGSKRRIHRGPYIEKSCSCFVTAPVFWEAVDPTCPYQLIPLSELTPEYQTVANYVKNDGLLSKSIVSISRIQNVDLWEMYCRKKKQLMRIQKVERIAERRLFHGTDTKNIGTICKYNFDLGLAGQHGHLYGKGIYFSRYASLAARYSDGAHLVPVNGRDDTKIIFLARVMVGKSNAGQPHFTKSDHDSAENVHNSCVDNIVNPTIFVIFDPNQIYPEYLIRYK
ncbi:protein mono-ADP-ribosyltransferase PARP11 [Pholidichthys leucotaenia]